MVSLRWRVFYQKNFFITLWKGVERYFSQLYCSLSVLDQSLLINPKMLFYFIFNMLDRRHCVNFLFFCFQARKIKGAIWSQFCGLQLQWLYSLTFRFQRCDYPSVVFLTVIHQDNTHLLVLKFLDFSLRNYQNKFQKFWFLRTSLKSALDKKLKNIHNSVLCCTVRRKHFFKCSSYSWILLFFFLWYY